MPALIEDYALIGDTARSRQDGDAIGSRRIQHGFHFRCPRKRWASMERTTCINRVPTGPVPRTRVTTFGKTRNRQARRFILGICHKNFQPSCIRVFARWRGPGVKAWNLELNPKTDRHERREMRMRFIIGRSKDWNSLASPNHAAPEFRPHRHHCLSLCPH